MPSLVTTDPQITALRSRLTRVSDLKAAAAVLDWDQSTYMPSGGGEARARQLATLSQIAHTEFTDPALGEILADLETRISDLSQEEAQLVRVTQHDYQRAVRVPADFMAILRNHQATTYAAWARAREADDFASICPLLEKTLDLSLQLASFYGYEDSPADPLIEDLDPGMTAAKIRTLFADLKDQLVPIAKQVLEQPTADDSCLHQDFAEEHQLAFALQIAEAFGYDLNRGRQDLTHHPFTTTFSIGDVRITTRVQRQDLGDCLFSTLHEAGHALYEQGIAPELEATPLATGISAGVHESQSRLWENVVGRSQECWEHFYPHLQQIFPDQLGNVSLETFYRAINKVVPSLIRTDADELTYNLHVMMRFELELDLLEGRLAVTDLPDTWNSRIEANLGIRPPNDRLGVLQDVHWYAGQIGGVFQGYTLGNIMAAQFFDAALNAHPEIPQEICSGHFQTLHSWLKTSLYQFGRRFSAEDVLKQATGSDLSIEPYLAYIRRKYGELYALA